MNEKWSPLSQTQLREALGEADLRVLLMVLFHLTADRKWLSDPFLPKRDVNLIADTEAGLPVKVGVEIRKKAAELLSANQLDVAIDDPGNEMMTKLMSLCLGEAVPPEYAPMMREEMGFVSRQVDWSDGKPDSMPILRPVVIVGAGASGIALGANLVKLGIPFVILEKNSQVGGTWHENIYPGCGVDTPNHAYSFSFGSRNSWSRYFAPRDEIQDYLIRSADDAGVRSYIEFNTSVKKVDWDAENHCWCVTFDGPEGPGELQAMSLVSAIGQLSLPSIPPIEGVKDFKGPIFHTANWPEGLKLDGQKVAIIGTGASSMQIVPSIADRVASLHIYQRSAQWARPIPKYHDPIPEASQWLLEKVPYYAAWFRFAMLWRYGDGLLPSLRKDPNWGQPDRSLNRSNERHRVQMTEHILKELAGRQDLIDKCLPTYPPYGKRILLDNGWYAAIKKPNVELVTDDIRRITRNGVETVDGTLRTADIVILATGFKVSLMAARLNVTGLRGQNLADVWANDNPSAHLGITVPEFPNLFSMQGPNTGLGHGGSAIFQAECQAHYITACLVQMIERGIGVIDVRREVHDAYVRRVDTEHEGLIWTHPGMSTYYRNAKGRVVSVMPWRLVDYWSMTHQPDFTEYHLTALK
tara:strand:- start:21569 stop:23485 length:1917 start_codon:yes stop_codon:yes gene_type:complete